ncbi:5-formyltetrahydrofolate cyclo-ligase [Candidatus Sumerlaeota bacterium]|nr:5-formyltetrahydrofolate cyclo-ligase [Candidatus Sumerlaeota bacterium]
MSMNKSYLRSQFLSTRDGVPSADRRAMSRAICRRLLRHEIWPPQGRVMCYVSFRGEVETRLLLHDALDNGLTLAVPYIDPPTDEMRACDMDSLENDWTRGAFGILEPAPEKRMAIQPEDIDLCIVPGVAWTEAGYRIGYGRGYYDRFLTERPDGMICVGLAFECQLSNDLPVEPHDIPVDWLMTELRAIHCRDFAKEPKPLIQ